MSLEQPNSPAIFLEQEAPTIEVAIDIASEALAESIHEGTITITVTAKISDPIKVTSLDTKRLPPSESRNERTICGTKTAVSAPPISKL